MTRQPGVLKYELLLVLISMIWGTTFVAQQIGMAKGLGPMTYNGLRFALGVCVLIPVMRWRRQKGIAVGRPPIRGSLFAGLFLFGAVSLQQVGLLYTSSANAGFITGFYILFVPLIGIFLGQRPARSLWLGVAVCLAGFYLLSVTGGISVGKGDMLILACSVLWAAQILAIGRIATQGDAVEIAAIQFAFTALLSGVAAVLFESVSMDALRDGAPAVAYAGVLSVGVAFTLQVICQKRCPPAPAAIIMSAEAIFAALAGYFVLGQVLTPRAMVGCLLILSGILIAQLVPIIHRRRMQQRQKETTTP